jgi:hypothetical protein
MFCTSVLKVCKVLRTSSVIVRVKFVRSFSYLLGTATSINLTNSSGVGLGATVDVAVSIVMMAHTHELLPPCLGHLLPEFLLECPPLCLGKILHCHADRLVRPDLGPGTTLLRVGNSFNKSV